MSIILDTEPQKRKIKVRGTMTKIRQTKLLNKRKKIFISFFFNIVALYLY